MVELKTAEHVAHYMVGNISLRKVLKLSSSVHITRILLMRLEKKIQMHLFGIKNASSIAQSIAPIR